MSAEQARTAALFTHEGYRYTVVTIANGVNGVEAVTCSPLPARRLGNVRRVHRRGVACALLRLEGCCN
jgi:hypothetical protein